LQAFLLSSVAHTDIFKTMLVKSQIISSQMLNKYLFRVLDHVNVFRRMWLHMHYFGHVRKALAHREKKSLIIINNHRAQTVQYIPGPLMKVLTQLVKHSR